ncbi:hypothetical protein [Capnocytophaga leadbetteri]
MAKVQIYFGLPRPPHNVYIFTPPTSPTRPTCPTHLTCPIPPSCPSCPTRPTIAFVLMVSILYF